MFFTFCYHQSSHYEVHPWQHCAPRFSHPPNNTSSVEVLRSVKNNELFKRVLEAGSKKDVVIDGTFKRINNHKYIISTMEQTKTLMTCTDNKCWICDDNIHTLAFGH